MGIKCETVISADEPYVKCSFGAEVGARHAKCPLTSLDSLDDFLNSTGPVADTATPNDSSQLTGSSNDGNDSDTTAADASPAVTSAGTSTKRVKK